MNKYLETNLLSKVGSILIIFFFIGIIISSILIKIPYGAVISGQFIHNGNPVIIKTATEGYVKRFELSDNETVSLKSGDAILEFDQEFEEKEIENLKLRKTFLMTAINRTDAEIEGRQFTVENDLPSEYQYIFDKELSLYNEKNNEKNRLIEIYRNRVENASDLLLDLDKRQDLTEKNRKMALESFDIIEKLHYKGVKSRLEYLKAQKTLSDAENALIEANININNIRKSVTENKLQIQSIQDKFTKEAQDEQIQLIKSMKEIESKILEFESILVKKKITSPIDGIIMLISTPKKGEWINKGEVIGKIIPVDEPLFLEGKILSNDIDNIELYNKVKVTPNGIKDRNQFPIEGEVFYISSDTIQEETPQGIISYYTVKISVNPREFESHYGIPLSSGMPATGIIQNKDRTIIKYFFNPFINSFRSSFLE